MYNNSTFFIGVDLGDKRSYIAILNQDGVLIEETRLPTSKTSFHQRFFALPPSRVAMEVGSHSRWASHLRPLPMATLRRSRRSWRWTISRP